MIIKPKQKNIDEALLQLNIKKPLYIVSTLKDIGVDARGSMGARETRN